MAFPVTLFQSILTWKNNPFNWFGLWIFFWGTCLDQQKQCISKLLTTVLSPPCSPLPFNEPNNVLNAPDSEEDAPQQLLPLPDALPVDPDLDDLKVAPAGFEIAVRLPRYLKFTSSVVDPDPVGFGTFRTCRIQVRIRPFWHKLLTV